MTKHWKDARAVDELIVLIERGADPAFVLFWGHSPKQAGVADESCFSNWFPASFVLDGVEYPTTEHYMMAEKARLFGDDAMCDKILLAKTPKEAKACGRRVSDFDNEVWSGHRFEIVVTGNEAKFSQHELLGDYLKNTHDAVLVETSPHDRIWGIGMGRKNANARHPQYWRGLNLLGFALMEVRERLST